MLDQRVGFAVPASQEFSGDLVQRGLAWMSGWFHSWILNLMAEAGRKLSELVAELPAYTIVKEKYAAERDRLPGLFAALERRWPAAAVNRLDGLRLDWPDRWVHVRPSNTEPIVRVIAEARREEVARELCRAVGEMLRA